ncbi:MAG TPA: peptidoglycan bridge formation glycyltransferase FemA/FemB family protein [Anaerolineales bacterium]|jgi:lipid II:glycine glycyltransferase (peptidoglycan interpeptide bridge formation enzyme)
MPEISLSEWRAFILAHPEIHLLQMAEWGELKSGFGWRAVRLLTAETGVQLLLRKLPFGLTIAYLPKPGLDPARWVRAETLRAEIDAVCRRNRAIFCKIELDCWQDESAAPPAYDAKSLPSRQDIQPPRTILIDLRGSEDEILGRMKQKTRYNIKLAEKKDVSVRPWQDLAAFHDMLQATGRRDGFGVHSLAYYQRAYELFHPIGGCELLVAEYEGRPLAALMVFAHGRRAWYVYGASTDEERNRMPTYLLQWAAMRWAKARGCDEYDLWGVPDEDEPTLEAGFESRRDGLWGVYRFKRGFGGELKRAVQVLDRVYMPWLYRLYISRRSVGEAA